MCLNIRSSKDGNPGLFCPWCLLTGPEYLTPVSQGYRLVKYTAKAPFLSLLSEQPSSKLKPVLDWKISGGKYPSRGESMLHLLIGAGNSETGRSWKVACDANKYIFWNV